MGPDAGRCLQCALTVFILPLSDSQISLPPNGQPQLYGLPPGQSLAMIPPVGHILPGQPLPGTAGLPGFPGVFPPQNSAQQQVDGSFC